MEACGGCMGFSVKVFVERGGSVDEVTMGGEHGGMFTCSRGMVAKQSHS